MVGIADGAGGGAVVSLAVGLVVLSVVAPVVVVADGHVSRAGVTTVSDCRTIDSPGRYVLSQNVDGGRSPCIEITAANVTLDGAGHHVRYTGSDAAGTTGIRVDVGGLSPSVRVENVEVRNWGQGVTVRTPNATLADVTAHDNRFGVVVEDANEVTLRRVTAYFNRYDGIYAESARFLTVEDSTLYTNERHGVFLNRSDDATVRDTRAYDHPAGDGVLLHESSSSRLVEVNASDNVDGVVLRASSDDNVLVGTVATGNRVDGIAVVDSRNATVRETNASANARAGVHLDGAVAAEFENTTATANRGPGPGDGFGVLIRNGSRDARFRGTRASDNGRSGVAVLFSDDVEFADTAARANGDFGAVVGDSRRVRFQGFAATGNHGGGVRIAASRSVALVDANASDNRPPSSGDGTSHGIFVSRSTDVTVRDATVVRNNGTGIRTETTVSLALRDVTVEANDGSGVVLTTTRRGAGAHVSVRDARVRANDGDGFYVINHRNVTVTGLNSSGNGIDGVVLAAARGQLRDTVALTDSVVRDNGDDGVVAARLRNLSVVRTNASGNGNRGITMTNVTGARVADSAFTDNEAHGVRAADLFDSSVVDVRVRDNRANGLWVANGSNVVVRDSLAAANGFPGLVVSNVSDAVLRDNRATGNDISGIELVDNDGAVLRNNTVVGTDPRPGGGNGNGFALYDSDDVTLADNAVRNSAGDGFFLDGSDDARFRGATARNNSGWAVALTGGSHNATATGFRLAPAGGVARSTPTTLDFDASNVSLAPNPTPPADPGGRANVGAYVDAAGTNARPSLSLTVHYRPADAANVSEATLRPWYYDRPTGTWHRLSGPNRTDPSANEVFASVPRGRLLGRTTIAPLGVPEGHRVADYGDAPDPPYRTLADSDGASHAVSEHEWLGPTVTREFDARTPNDDGADDGVAFHREAGELSLAADVTVANRTSGRYSDAPGERVSVAVWVDRDGDGWDGPPVARRSVDPSTWSTDQRTLSLATGRRVATDAWVRVRLAYGETLTTPTGSARFGEVEDYHLVALTVTANRTTAARGDPVAFTVRRADTNDTVNATLSVGGATLSTGADGRVVYAPTANGTVTATASASAPNVTFLDGTAAVSVGSGNRTPGGRDTGGPTGGGESGNETAAVRDAYDRNGASGIQIGEVVTAVKDWAAGELPDERLYAVIDAWDGG